MGSVQRVGTVIERAYGADGLTIACQVLNSFMLLLDKNERVTNS
jgi:hypothetical protein